MTPYFKVVVNVLIQYVVILDQVLHDFLVTVKAASHECVISSGQP